jgi:hypothetical protein
VGRTATGGSSGMELCAPFLSAPLLLASPFINCKRDAVRGSLIMCTPYFSRKSSLRMGEFSTTSTDEPSVKMVRRLGALARTWSSSFYFIRNVFDRYLPRFSGAQRARLQSCVCVGRSGSATRVRSQNQEVKSNKPTLVLPSQLVLL